MKPLALAYAFLTGVTLAAQTNTFPASGNVGIGTSAPEASLDVNGSIIARGPDSFVAKAPDGYWGFSHHNFFAGRAGNVYGRGFSSQAIGIFNGSTTAEDIFLFNQNHPDAGFLVLKASGNVGVGTSAPEASLDVNGSIIARGPDSFVAKAPDGSWGFRHGNFFAGRAGNVYGQGFSSQAIGIFNGSTTAEDIVLFNQNHPDAGFLVVKASGNVGVGTTNPTHKLAVNGAIKAKEIIVETTGWSDHVFAADYVLPPLAEVEAHIKAHQHLPGMPSAAQVAAEGVALGELQVRLLAKIEELTLHQIAQQKALAQQERQLAAQTATVIAQAEELASLRSEVRALRTANHR